jgi:hypothetical protein
VRRLGAQPRVAAVLPARVCCTGARVRPACVWCVV